MIQGKKSARKVSISGSPANYRAATWLGHHRDKKVDASLKKLATDVISLRSSGMSRPLTVQTSLTPDELAKIAKKEPNPRVRQRLLAVRLVVMGNTAPQAAKAVGLKQRQSRNWIHRFNDEGVNGLRDRGAAKFFVDTVILC